MSHLQGMEQICDYFGRGEASVLKLIREEGFPAVKIAGTWESKKDIIDDWRDSKIKNSQGNG